MRRPAMVRCSLVMLVVVTMRAWVSAAEPDGAAIEFEREGMLFRLVSPKRYDIDRPDLYLSETEVTNATHAAYLTETKGRKGDADVLKAFESKRLLYDTASPSYWIDNKERVWRESEHPVGTEDQPVSLVNVEQAEAFCAWLTKRHPKRGTF